MKLELPGIEQHHVAIISLQAEYTEDWLTVRNSVDNTLKNVFFPFLRHHSFLLYPLLQGMETGAYEMSHVLSYSSTPVLAKIKMKGLERWFRN